MKVLSRATHVAILGLSMSMLMMSTQAWIPTSTQHRIRLHATQSSLSSVNPRNDSEETSPSSASSRRDWLAGVTAATAGLIASGCASPVVPPVGAAELISTANSCDPSVSVWKKGSRVVYLLGTAHISSASAALAGNLVQDVHPSGVMVELDPKRIRGSGILAQRVDVDGEQSAPSKTSKVIVPNIQSLPPTAVGGPPQAALLASTTSSGASMAAPAAPPITPPPKPNPMMRAASVAVGNSIKGMYKKLDSAGFQAGEEFVVAMREGQKIGSDIVLGDRDVEVTLQRVTEGLAKTDLKALMNPDSELEQALKELTPSSSKTPAMTASGANEMGGDLNDPEFRQEFSDFVETMKAKENVQKIMNQLQRLAPALYEALVSERDAYMAAGLNGLDELETIVAVMGIAHVNGVEANLSMNGWKAASPACAAR